MNVNFLRKMSIACLVNIAAMANVQVAEASPLSWNSWSLDYDVSGDYDGLSLKNVTYQGVKLAKKISLPVMRVFYDNNRCGPFADRLGGDLSPIPWANNATIAQRQFTLDGRLWYEIGIRDQIGNYDIYQVYYLSSDGILDAHIYGKGLQCINNHIHYPNWRIDMDIDGPANDIIEHLTGSTFQLDGTEFNRKASDATNHTWRVRDILSSIYVDILPGFPGFSIPGGSTIPVSDYSKNTVFGRLYKGSEDGGWIYGPNIQVPFGDNENISNQDLVLWYEAYLPHPASDGTELWHSTGIRLVSSITPIQEPQLPDLVVSSISYNNGVFASTVKNQGTANTPPGNTVRVGYSVDGALKTYGNLATSLTAGASAAIGTTGATYIIPSGTHNITATADDVNRITELNEANNKLTKSVNVNVSDTVPPSVAITNPASGSILSGTSVITTANATDASGIASVQFKLDGDNLGAKDTVAPFSVNWNTVNVANGKHVLTAFAQDKVGNTATSSGISITVNNSTASRLPDVIVTSLSYSNGKFQCTVKNQGTAATPKGIVIGVGYLVDGIFKTYGAKVGSLAAGASANIGTNGRSHFITNGAHTITANVDDVHRFIESNENNNKLNKSISVP